MAGSIELITTRPEVARIVGELAVRAGVGVIAPAGGTSEAVGDGCRLLVVDGSMDTDRSIDSLDAPGRSGVPGRPGPPVVVVHLAGEAPVACAFADRAGAVAVVELPAAGSWLVDQMAGPAPSPVLAVVGALGGAGATTVALAGAVSAGGDCLLVDADPRSTGLDLPLGIAVDHGGRWDAVPDTTEPLVANTLRSALPRVLGMTVLTGTAPVPGSARVPAAVAVGRSGFQRAVIDCGRDLAGVPLEPGDSLVLVCPATLAGVVGARRVLDATPEGVRAQLAIRPTPWLPTDEIVELLGVAALELPRLPRLAEAADSGELLSGRAGRDLARLGAGVWQALA
jgi:hypothetical protein